MPRPETTGGETAARLATMPERLPLNETRLIGIVGAAGARRALLRDRDGSVRTVEYGGTAFGGVVLAIAEDRIHVDLPSGPITVALVDYSPSYPSPRPVLRPRSMPTG